MKGNLEKKIMRKTMRKIGMMTIFFCLIAMMAAGCKKEEKEEVTKKKERLMNSFMTNFQNQIKKCQMRKMKKSREEWKTGQNLSCW